MQGRHRRLSLLLQRLLALFAAGALLFNYPLLQLWLGPRTVLGLPLLPLALLVSWCVLIGALAWLMEGGQGPSGQQEGQQEGQSDGLSEGQQTPQRPKPGHGV